MDLRQLRSFLAVLDQGSFSSAADALFTVQSNVSSHVARLETELGTTLLDRRSRELTPAGIVVERRGREVLRQLAAVSDDLAALENRVIGEVACGTTPSIGLRVIPPMLATATQELPEVSVTVAEAHSGQLVQQLLAGDIDVAITTGANNPELSSTPLFTEDIVAVLATDSELCASDNVTIAELNKQKLLLPLQDNPLYEHISSAFTHAGIALQTGLEVGSSSLVQAMVGAGVGVALIPATAAADGDGLDVAVRPIKGMAPRNVALSLRNSTQNDRATVAIHGLLERTARQAATWMPGCHPTPEATAEQTQVSPQDPEDVLDVVSMRE